MPNEKDIVINTGPMIALIAGVGGLEILQSLYRRVLVPLEVTQEITAKGPDIFTYAPFMAASWLSRWNEPVTIDPVLAYSLDKGEASVIELALKQKIKTVCIDETAGRRIARLYNLSVTGSLGILLRAKREGLIPSIRAPIERMTKHGVWLSESVIRLALNEAREL